MFYGAPFKGHIVRVHYGWTWTRKFDAGPLRDRGTRYVQKFQAIRIICIDKFTEVDYIFDPLIGTISYVETSGIKIDNGHQWPIIKWPYQILVYKGLVRFLILNNNTIGVILIMLNSLAVLNIHPCFNFNNNEIRRNITYLKAKIEQKSDMFPWNYSGLLSNSYN